MARMLGVSAVDGRGRERSLAALLRAALTRPGLGAGGRNIILVGTNAG